MSSELEIDNIDRQILSILMQDAQIPYTEIAKRIYVSGGTVHVRMKKLIEMGIVKGSQLMVEPTALGFDITAFIGIYLLKSSLYHKVLNSLKEIPEVVGCHYTTGNYSMFIKIICRDTQHLKEVLYDKLQPISGIDRTETFISLEESISRPITLIAEEQAEGNEASTAE